MSKGNRNRKYRSEQPEKKWQPNAKEEKLMNDAIREQILEMETQFSNDHDAAMLWALHLEFGFGKKRLKRFHKRFYQLHKQLIEHYESNKMGDIGFVCRKNLLTIDVDIAAWNAEPMEE